MYVKQWSQLNMHIKWRCSQSSGCVFKSRCVLISSCHFCCQPKMSSISLNWQKLSRFGHNSKRCIQNRFFPPYYPYSTTCDLMEIKNTKYLPTLDGCNCGSHTSTLMDALDVDAVSQADLTGIQQNMQRPQVVKMGIYIKTNKLSLEMAKWGQTRPTASNP